MDDPKNRHAAESYPPRHFQGAYLLPQRGGTNVPLGAGGSTHALGAAASTALGVGAAASATDDLETKLRRVEAERDELRRAVGLDFRPPAEGAQ